MRSVRDRLNELYLVLAELLEPSWLLCALRRLEKGSCLGWREDFQVSRGRFFERLDKVVHVLHY